MTSKQVGHVFWVILLVIGGPMACSTTPPVEYYTLSTLSGIPRDATPTVMGETVAIGLGPVVFPQYLDRPQIVTRNSPNRIQVSEFHRWADSLPETFSRIIAQNISMLLPAVRVAVFPWEDWFHPVFRIKLDVEQFDAGISGQVLLNVAWSIRNQAGIDELVVKHTVITEPVPSDGYEALVAAESRALAALSRIIADEIMTLKTRTSK